MKRSAMHLASGWVGLSVMLLVGLAGCDRGPAMAPAEGVVLLDGQPISGGQGVVRFQPRQGFQFARGEIGPDGRFELETAGLGPGAIIGEHEVAVSYTKPPPQTDGEAVVGESLVPSHYADGSTSGLRETVSADPEQNKFTIELSSQRP